MYLACTKDEEGNSVIEHREAEVAKQIYWEYLEVAKPTPDWTWLESRRDSYWGREDEVASGNTEEDPAE